MSKIKEISIQDEVNELLYTEKLECDNYDDSCDTIDEDVEKNNEYTQITKQILNISEELQSLDEYFNELPSLQSQVDEEISDLLHYIENNELTPKQSKKMIELIRQKRLIRRGLCNDYEIKRVYNTHRNKLAMDNQRKFFLQEIHKKAKELNSQYRYRQFGVNEENTLKRKEIAEKEIVDLLK